jgi:hypothetical protein
MGDELFLKAGVPELVGSTGLPQYTSSVGLFKEAHETPGEPAPGSKPDPDHLKSNPWAERNSH